jgi:hypothetical protein
MPDYHFGVGRKAINPIMVLLLVGQPFRFLGRWPPGVPPCTFLSFVVFGGFRGL